MKSLKRDLPTKVEFNMRRLRRYVLRRLSNSVYRQTLQLNDQTVNDLRTVVEACSKEIAELKLRIDDLTLKLQQKKD